MKIVILDAYTTDPNGLAWKALQTMGDLTVYDRTPSEETVLRAKDAEIVLTNKVLMKRREIEQLPKLRYIGVLATGYNVVDLEAASEHGITVANVPAYSTESVAQMVFAHLLTVTNHVEHYAHENRKGRWAACTDFCYWDTPLTELAGKTFGIVGLGNIGQRVAAIAHAFAMNVVAYTSKSADALPPYIRKTDAERAVGRKRRAELALSSDTRHPAPHLSPDAAEDEVDSHPYQYRSRSAGQRSGRGRGIERPSPQGLLRRCTDGGTAQGECESATAVRQCLYHPAYRLGFCRGACPSGGCGHRQCARLCRWDAAECSQSRLMPRS